MVRTRVLASMGVVLAGAVLTFTVLWPGKYSNSPSAYHATLEHYCFQCHSSSAPRAGVNLRTLDVANFESNGVTWEKLLRKLRNREMPPAGRWRPDESTY